MNYFRTSKQCFILSIGAVEFLKGMSSNTLESCQNAFLSVHGKIVATFDQKLLKDDRVLIVMEEQYVQQTINHLDRYLRLSGVQVEYLQDKVYWILEDTAQENIEKVFGADCQLIKQKAGSFVVSKNDIASNITEDNFLLFRLENQLPLLGVDYHDDFVLNVSMKDFVSFTKGCFLGQEPVSKVYNRSKPTWKLLVKDYNECSSEEQEKMTSIYFDATQEKKMGFVFVKNI